MKQMRSRKCPGPDNISFELIKHEGLPLPTRMFPFFLKIWEFQQILKGMKVAVIITIFKKCDWRTFGNYRGIALILITRKIFAMIILNQLPTIAERFSQNLSVDSVILVVQSPWHSVQAGNKTSFFFIFYGADKYFDRVQGLICGMLFIVLDDPPICHALLEPEG